MRNLMSMLIPSLFLVVSVPLLGLAGETVELARGSAPGHPQQPQVAVDEDESIHVVYGAGDTIFYQRSRDSGATFSKQVALPSVNAMSLGMRRGPRVAAANGRVCVTAIGGRQGKGRDGDVLVFHSSDGITWQGPIMVNDSADSAREGLHAMAAGPDGKLCCVWLDLRNRRSEVMASMSSDGGRTWAKNVLVYQSPDGNVCECCHPSVAFDGKGTVFVQWRNSLGGKRDMYFAASSDGGKSFGKAVKLGRGQWTLKACPMDGGAIAATAPGKVATAWRRENEVFLVSEASVEERRLGTGEQPWIAATADGPYVVWLKKRGDVAWLLAPGRTEPIQLANHAADPVIAACANLHGPVVAVWESRGEKDHAIQCRVVSD